MRSVLRRTFGGATALIAAAALASGTFLAPAAATVTTPNIIAPTAGATQINLLGFNDFHGRILDAERFAATLLLAEQGFDAGHTLLLSNGDAVGSSIFESSIQQDQPTVDILNALGVDSYTQGNHEFDRGIDDAAGRLQDATNGPDLAANVTAADGSKPFDEYASFQVHGVSVAVIGAVTQDTPSLVSPDGIQGLTFGDPVAAVNEVASRLSDGDPSNGEAQIIIASYHEGGPLSNARLDENLQDETFAHLVNDTSAEVDVIFNAHSHRTYAYDAPVGTATRPVVQAGEYGGNIAQVVLTIDQTGAVTAAESSVVPTLAATALETLPDAVKSDQRLARVASIVADAKEQAEVLGAEIVGLQSSDLSRAKKLNTDGSTNEDDRANSSSLADVVATSALEAVLATGRQVDLALINPGGVRADLLNDDGKISYKEAATILPFANNLSVATLSGAGLKAILEEQWQTNPDGSIPSRPYLQLGQSDGFVYTYDSSRQQGDRITGIYLNGTAIDPAASYQVVAPTFLTAGGDNFRSFRNASAVQDTGLIDLDAFVSWIRSKSSGEGATGVVPDLQRNNFEIVGFPPEGAVAAGQSLTLTLGKFDQGSVGAVPNTELVATAYVVDGEGIASSIELGRASVSGSTATLTLGFPANFGADTFDVLIEAKPSGSYVLVPVEVTAAAAAVTPITQPSASASAAATVPAKKPVADAGTESGSSADTLAATGAEANTVFGTVAVALTAIVLGAAAVLFARRRPL